MSSQQNQPTEEKPFANTELVTVDGNAAASHVAYLTSEIISIYPITPSSAMGEQADEQAGQQVPNVFGFIPIVSEMQSEGGASGAVHGSLTAGALTTTFTASQGLMLMFPNMYKIAAELTPTVFHVSARSMSCQALSIFGDHSDVMAARTTGFGLVASANIQEIMDIAAVTIRASLKSRIPFVHFFDGFRSSHEIQKIRQLEAKFFWSFLDIQDIYACRERALDPWQPTLRGTAQNPDLYFQGRETVNRFYDATPKIFEDSFDKFYDLTGRRYHCYEYFGASNAEDIIVIMGSGAEACHEVVEYLNRKKGAKLGLLKVRLYRPFSGEMFLAAIPKTVKAVVVLDRTKEPGAPGEPLYQDVLTAFSRSQTGIDGYPKFEKQPLIVGGRYGLSSKEFNPPMVKGIFNHLAALKKPGAKLWTGFTVGINDDVTHLSIPVEECFMTENEDAFRGKFYGLGADGTVGANKNSIKIIGENSNKYVQGYFVYDSKKAGAVTVSHLRFSDQPIHSTYLISEPSFVAVHNPTFIGRYDVLEGIEEGGTVLLNVQMPNEQIFESLPLDLQQTIIDKKLKLYAIDAFKIADEEGLGGRINTTMQAAFFKIANILPDEVWINAIEEAIVKSYGAKGQDIVDMNVRAFKRGYTDFFAVPIPKKVQKSTFVAKELKYAPDSPAAHFIEAVIKPVLKAKGDLVPVSEMPINGAFPTGSCALEKRNIANYLPQWDTNLCIQCCTCSYVCPHATVLPKLIDEDVFKEKVKLGTEVFPTIPARGKFENPVHFRIQVAPEDCTGCGACAQMCLGRERDPETKKETGRRALTMIPSDKIHETLKQSYETFLSLPPTPEKYINVGAFRDVQFKQPLFEFSGACSGCGETPYIKLVTQLCGDRMYVANATGCSSIYGGTAPTVPYTKNPEGHGPAWQSSLFEDNAEFGFGIAVGARKLREMAYSKVDAVIAGLSSISQHQNLLETLRQIKTIYHSENGSSSTALKQAIFILQDQLKDVLAKKDLNSQLKFDLKFLQNLATHLIEKVVWSVGGDGWAYDIGYGGLDHVVSYGENMNILVLDTEVYSNTGGQNSKATPLAAVAKFASAGKRRPKKDLGLMAMAYKTAYVTQVAYGANPSQTLKALREAIEFPGTSLVICYCPCIEHGIPMELGPFHSKLAVECGYWSLYRYDPRLLEEGKNPLQLDSKAPKAEFKDFALKERRFRRLQIEYPEIAGKLMEEANKVVKRNFKYYEMLAGLDFSKINS